MLPLPSKNDSSIHLLFHISKHSFTTKSIFSVSAFVFKPDRKSIKSLFILPTWTSKAGATSKRLHTATQQPTYLPTLIYYILSFSHLHKQTCVSQWNQRRNTTTRRKSFLRGHTVSRTATRTATHTVIPASTITTITLAIPLLITRRRERAARPLTGTTAAPGSAHTALASAPAASGAASSRRESCTRRRRRAVMCKSLTWLSI